MTLSDKLKSIFTSVRFLQLLVVAALQVLVIMNVIDSAQGEALTQVIQTLLLGSVAIGTVDSVATKASAPVVQVEAPATVNAEQVVTEEQVVRTDTIDNALADLQK